MRANVGPLGHSATWKGGSHAVRAGCVAASSRIGSLAFIQSLASPRITDTHFKFHTRTPKSLTPLTLLEVWVFPVRVERGASVGLGSLLYLLGLRFCLLYDGVLGLPSGLLSQFPWLRSGQGNVNPTLSDAWLSPVGLNQ